MSSSNGNGSNGDKRDAGPITEDVELTNNVQKTVRMPVERYAREYNMNHPNRGMAVIFNHETYENHLRQPTRAGTKKDCDDLKNVLEELHFTVHVHEDYKWDDIKSTVEKAAKTDHTNSDCIMVVILSHGENNIIYASDGIYKLENITQFFTADKCPTLAGKPKIFVIQACRGDNLDSGIKMCAVETDGESNTSMSYTIPLHSDFLYAFSTIPGFYSWRSTTNGTWFIQSLVHELKRNGKKENILTLLTFVSQRVAIDYESNVPDKPYIHQQKQIPCITSMLTRILRFTDK